MSLLVMVSVISPWFISILSIYGFILNYTVLQKLTMILIPKIFFLSVETMTIYSLNQSWFFLLFLSFAITTVTGLVFFRQKYFERTFITALRKALSDRIVLPLKHLFIWLTTWFLFSWSLQTFTESIELMTLFQFVKKVKLIVVAFKSSCFSWQLFLFTYWISGSGTEEYWEKIIFIAQGFGLDFFVPGNFFTD